MVGEKKEKKKNCTIILGIVFFSSLKQGWGQNKKVFCTLFDNRRKEDMILQVHLVCVRFTQVCAKCHHTAIMTSKFLCEIGTERWMSRFQGVKLTQLSVLTPHDAVSASISTKPANLLLFRSHFVCKYFQQCVYSLGMK